MRFMSLWRPAATANPPSSGKMMEEMGALINDMQQKGVLVLTGGWNPETPCTALKMSDGKLTITDGPYTESKELIAGFCVFDTANKEEAIQWSERFLRIAGNGVSEMRPLEH